MTLISSRPPELYNAQDERVFRQRLAQKLTQLEQGGAAGAVVLSVVMSFAHDGSLKVSVVGNDAVLSLKAAVSTTAFPTTATVVAATATNATRADLSFAGPYALGNTLYLSAMGFTAIDGAGSASAKYDAQAAVAVIQPTLSLAIEQTAQSGVTTTFTLVVTDPSAVLSGNALVSVTWNGLTGLYNNTLAAAVATPSSFNATLGATYSFTATLDPALITGAFARFVATKVGAAYAGTGTWYGVASGVAAWLNLRDVVGETTVTIYWDGAPSVERSINGGSWSTPPASPIIVTRPAAGGASVAHTFRTAVGDVGGPAGGTVRIDPQLATPPAVPAITSGYLADGFTPGDGGGEVDIVFAWENMPVGATFTITAVSTAGAPTTAASATASGITASPYTLAMALGTGAALDVTITAYTSGAVFITDFEFGSVVPV